MADSDTNMADTNDPSVPTAGCPFQKVPLEVLLRITNFLTTPELGNVRRTCSSIERSLYFTFVKEFFTRKQFMLSDDSLQALIDISKSRLSDHLRMVQFGLERYPSYPYSRGDDQRDSKFLQRHAGMLTLWSTGYHRDMLAEAFGNLKNLDEIVIRDFNSTRRTRDGPVAQWTSYGAPTASAETGVNFAQRFLGSPDMTIPFSNQVFGAVLFALGQAGAKPKGIEVIAREGNHLKDVAFNVPSYMEPVVKPVLENLEKLHLDIDLSWRRPGFGPPMTRTGAMGDFYLRNFLLKTSNLKHLRINEVNSEEKILKSVLEWLSKPSTTTAPQVSPHVPAVPFPDLPHLEEINLGQMNFEESMVVNLLKKFAPPLKRFELNRATLERKLPTDHTGAPPKINFWSSFLKKLADIPGLDLHHISIRAVQQS